MSESKMPPTTECSIPIGHPSEAIFGLATWLGVFTGSFQTRTDDPNTYNLQIQDST
ncbi:hypothetical protein Ancab_020738, partial [Ancistrocladus abbreviatus]